MRWAGSASLARQAVGFVINEISFASNGHISWLARRLYYHHQTNEVRFSGSGCESRSSRSVRCWKRVAVERELNIKDIAPTGTGFKFRAMLHGKVARQDGTVLHSVWEKSSRNCASPPRDSFVVLGHNQLHLLCWRRSGNFMVAFARFSQERLINLCRLHFGCSIEHYYKRFWV